MNSIQFPNKDLVEASAADWVAKIDRGLSRSEESRLSQWLEESPVHGEMLVKCASMWDLLDVLAPIAKLMPMETLHDDLAGSSAPDSAAIVNARQRRKARYTTWAAAALVVFGIGVVVMNSLQHNVAFPSLVENPAPLAGKSNDSNLNTLADTSGQTYKTAVGEMSKVMLSDGSQLQLNTDSEVIVRFNETVRQLELLSGEVFFDVAKDPAKPFIVNVGADQVVAVGTAFNIDSRPGLETEVTVTEGKVKVNLNAENGASNVTGENLFLIPGQSVTITDSKPQVKDAQDTETLLAWREGMLIFQGESLEYAINEIDRYTSLRFTIVDKQLTKLPVGGFFKTGDTEQLLMILEQNFGVYSTQIDDEILLHGAR